MNVDEVSLALVELSDGDLLAISDILEFAEKCSQEHSDDPLVRGYSDGFAAHVRAHLKQAAALDRRFLSETLDALSTLLKSSAERRFEFGDELESRFDLWRQRYTALLSGAEPDAAHESDTVAPSQEPARAAPPEQAQNPFMQGEVFQVFLLDGAERLDTAQQLCLVLEKNPHDDAAIQELFRIFHTFKGECGFFRLASLGELAHIFENLLSLVREKKVQVEAGLVDLLLRGIDKFQVMLDSLSSRDVVIHNDIDVDDLRSQIEAFSVAARKPIGEKLVEAGVLTEHDRDTLLVKQKDSAFTKTIGELAVEKKMASAGDIEGVVSGRAAARQVVDQYMKVPASQINYLVDMIGELIIAQGQIGANDPALVSMRKITKEIQFAALKLRTTKLRSISSTAQRAVRELSQKLGKKVSLEIVGEDIEVDRNLVEALNEPFMHIFRNAVHHGIESVEKRLSAGKPEHGTIRLEAHRRGNSIVIGIEDDGKGLDRAAIVAKAVEQKLINTFQAQEMSDKEVWDLIFRPGFSTAAAIDQISGRGVGMDIVRTFVVSHRGRIDIHTVPGTSTRIDMSFPISTAIMDGMIVVAGELTLVIPVSQMLETLNFSDAVRFRVGGKVDVMNLRGMILPIIDLCDYFETPSKVNERRMGIVVEDSLQKRYLLLADSIVGKREVVVKPLGSRFKYIKAISSGTVLAGGQVGYIIDVESIIQGSGSE